MPGILISGEHSFIGNSYIKYSSNKEVRLISLRNIDPAGIDFSDIDIVIHLAAIVHVTNKISPGEYLRVNRDLTLNFAAQAKRAGVKHFIFMSTSKVFGRYEDGIVWNESTECKPADYYGISKYEAENELLKLNDDVFTVSIIRTPVVYGPGNKANMSKLVKLVRYLPLIPLGNTNNKRHFNYIENLVSFIDRVVETRLPGIFISMDPDPVSTTDLISYIADALNKRIALVPLPAFLRTLAYKVLPLKYEQLFGTFLIDNSISKKRLNYIPLFSTREGIYKTLKVSDE